MNGIDLMDLQILKKTAALKTTQRTKKTTPRKTNSETTANTTRRAKRATVLIPREKESW